MADQISINEGFFLGGQEKGRLAREASSQNQAQIENQQQQIANNRINDINSEIDGLVEQYGSVLKTQTAQNKPQVQQQFGGLFEQSVAPLLKELDALSGEGSSSVRAFEIKKQLAEMLPTQGEEFERDTQQGIGRAKSEIAAGVRADPTAKAPVDTFIDVVDGAGKVIGQRNARTNRFVSDPRTEAVKNTPRPESPVGKLIFDKQLVAETFGVDSPEYAEINANITDAQAKGEEVLRSKIVKFDIMDKSVDKAIDFLVDKSGGSMVTNEETGRLEFHGGIKGFLNPDPTGTATSAAMGLISGSDRKVAEELIAPIKANIGFQELAAMREASPTGGALGQVAVMELEALQASIASLKTSLPTPLLIANLQDVGEHYANWRSAVMAQESGVNFDEMTDEEVLRELGIGK